TFMYLVSPNPVGNTEHIKAPFRTLYKGFVPGQEKKNWTEAQKYCREYHTDLASVRNQSENEQIQSITADKQVWIGLHRLWVWSDNSTAAFTHWKPGEPSIGTNRNSICTSTGIRDEGRWTDEDCAHQRPFVCYDGLIHPKM
uniref:C-type lectin domain-containing protein n=1 Tax=Sinocyclocheilus rhinocerous TaxID=307959 RepID=A0A673GMD4_9TELE